MRSADVAIVGGGVIGASVAYHLAASGVRDIVILERGARPGEGSTGVATGGFRASFASAIDVRLSLLAREGLARFREETGVDPELVPAGYLWLATSEAELEALRRALRVQHAEGLAEAAEVGPDEIARLNPAIGGALEGAPRPADRIEGSGAVSRSPHRREGAGRREDARGEGDVGGAILGGLFCPTDGFMRPMKILEGYVAAAQRLGVRVEWGVEVTGVTRAAGGGIEPGPAEARATSSEGAIARRIVKRNGEGPITVLETTRGPIAAGAVVNAAGAWAGDLAALAGIDLPVTALRRQVAVTEPFTGLPATMPMTIFAGDGFHFRVRDGRVLLLWPDAGGPTVTADRGAPRDPFDTSVDPAWVAAVFEKARRRVPVLASADIDPAACRAGLYEMSPDRHAILGPAPGCANFYLANGSSGHGVMHAPALGRLLAEMMTTGEARSLDVTPLSPSRFAEGQAIGSEELL